MNKDQIIEAIKEMSVLELNELVQACEEEFGVSAAAGVVVAAAGEGGAAAEEQTEFTVVLKEVGAEKIKLLNIKMNQKTARLTCRLFLILKPRLFFSILQGYTGVYKI